MAKKGKRTFPDCEESFIWTNTTGSTVTAGSLLRVNGRLCIAYTDILNNGSGTLIVRGEFAFAKGTGYTLAQGDGMTWDGTKMVKWNATTGTPPDAICNVAAATNDTTVEGSLNSEPAWGGALVVKKVASAGDDTNNYIEVTHNFGANPSLVIPMLKSTANVYRAPAGAVTFPNVNTVRIADANLAVNEELHVIIAP